MATRAPVGANKILIHLHPIQANKKPTSQFDKEQLWARATFHLIQASLVRCVGWPFNLEIWSPPQSSFSRSPDDIASSCPPYIIGGSGLVLYTCGNIVKSYKKPLCQGELNWPCVYNAPPAWFMREARVALIKHRKNCECCPVSQLIVR